MTTIDLDFYQEYRNKTASLAEALDGIETLFSDYNIPLPQWFNAAKQSIKEMKRELRSMEAESLPESLDDK